MLEATVVMALVMFFTGIVKRAAKRYFNDEDIKKTVTPLAVIVLAVFFNTANALMFGGDPLASAKAGIMLGVESAGLYSLGKSIIRKS